MIKNLYFLGGFIFLSLAIGLVQFFAVSNEWYFNYWWLDIIMHFMGGLWIGIIFFIFASRFNYFYSSRRVFFIFLLIFVLLVGIFWEIFEYINGLSLFREDNYPLDTAIDLVLDTVGAIGAYYISLWYIKNAWKENFL